MSSSLHEDAAQAIDRALAARDSIERFILLERALELHRITRRAAPDEVRAPDAVRRSPSWRAGAG